MVSDVSNSSLQLVEMCSSEGVWSPVCDKNWTLLDATVICRELDQGKGLCCYMSILYHCVYNSFSSAISEYIKGVVAIYTTKKKAIFLLPEIDLNTQFNPRTSH